MTVQHVIVIGLLIAVIGLVVWCCFAIADRFDNDD